MKINHKEKIMKFEDVSVGTILRDEMNRIGIKISTINTKLQDFNFVRLETGDAYFLDSYEHVTIYPDAELTL